MDEVISSAINMLVEKISYIFQVIISFVFSSGFTRISVALLLLNSLGYYLMYRDKKLAKLNGEIKEQFPDEKEYKKNAYRRISEGTLLLTAMVGGSLGILLGMYKFRHKTKKGLFTIGVPVIIGLQIILFIYSLIKHFWA